jgi:micrococcal nuclease
MKACTIRTAALLALLVLWAVSVPAQGRVERVSSVPDGDTLILAGGGVVRLSGIDAPELARDGRPDQAYGREAREYLELMVGDGRVTIVPMGAGWDRYGRILAHVRTVEGRSLNEAMLEQGLAFLYPHQDLDARTLDRFLALQRRAMSAGKGFWPHILGLDGGRGSWVGNSRSMRFHAPSCPDGRRISERNRSPLSSLKEAFHEGYAPCRKCTPWPASKAGSRP